LVQTISLLNSFVLVSFATGLSTGSNFAATGQFVLPQQFMSGSHRHGFYAHAIDADRHPPARRLIERARASYFGKAKAMVSSP
jgi:hypothetical protein